MPQEKDTLASDTKGEAVPGNLLDRSILDSLIAAAMQEEGGADPADPAFSEQADLDGPIAPGSVKKDNGEEKDQRANRVEMDNPPVDSAAQVVSPLDRPPDEEAEGEPLTEEMIAALIAAASGKEPPPSTPAPREIEPAREPVVDVRPVPKAAPETKGKPEKYRLLPFQKIRALHRAEVIKVLTVVFVAGTLSFAAGLGYSHWRARGQAPAVLPVAENGLESEALSEPASSSAAPAVEALALEPPAPESLPIPETSSQAWTPPAEPVAASSAAEMPLPASERAQEIKPPPVADPKFDIVKAAFDTLSEKATGEDIDAVVDQINTYVGMTPQPPMTPQALFLKAQLYARKGLASVAYDVYHSLLMRYPDEPDRDEVLFTAAKAASELRRYPEAVNLLQALLDQFPKSPRASEAEVLLGDAYLALGRLSDASAVFERVLQSGPYTSQGTLAVARLGKIALEQHRLDDAVKLLESHPSIDPAVDGNDLIRLNLARAYRAAGRQTDARHILNELISFFPQSPLLPDAFNELSLLLEEMGMRPEALQVARQAIQQFPDKPACMIALGRLLVASGQKREGADSLYHAELAGAKDPESLLAAARNYMAVEAYPEAEEAYGRLLAEYGGTPQAYESNIEIADALYKNGQPKKAVQRLEDLASITTAGPRKLPVLLALAKIYRDLGLDSRAGQVFGEVASMSTEPEVLAQAGLALLNAGETEEAQKLVNKIDLKKVTPETARALLVKSSEVQLETDSKKAVATLEKAISPSPAERDEDDDRRLLAAYVAAGNGQRIEKLIARLDAHVKQNPVDTPRLQHALVVWGDYLFDKKAYADAASAFLRAIDVGDGNGGGPADREMTWAKFQCANACFRTDDVETCLPLYDQVAATDAPWAKQARAQADCIRLRQRVQKALDAETAAATATASKKPATTPP